MSRIERIVRVASLPFLIGTFILVASTTATRAFISSSVLEDCPATGDADGESRSDPDLNIQKNRTDVPDSFRATNFDDYADQEIPEGVSKRHRGQWSGTTRDAVLAEESKAIQLIGYLILQKLEGPESCNCHGEDQSERDIHLWLTNAQDDEKADAIVVEVAPRIRAQHPTWTRTRLGQLARTRTRVRVSGWVLLDEEHPEQVGRTRFTLWEIHPILKIEVRVGNQWREL